MSYTTIRVHEDTAEELQQLGRMGDSYDDVVRRLIEQTKSADVDDFEPTSPEKPVDDVVDDGRSTHDDPEPTSPETKPVDEWIDELDLPGNGPQLDRRRDAVRAAYDLIRQEGSIMSGEIKTRLYPEHPAGYGSQKSWWNNLVLDALRALAELDDDLYSPPSPRSNSPWQYDG